MLRASNPKLELPTEEISGIPISKEFWQKQDISQIYHLALEIEQEFIDDYGLLDSENNKRLLILLRNVSARLEELSTPELIASCMAFIERAENKSNLSYGYQGQQYLQARAIVSYCLGNYALAARLAGITANVWTCRLNLLKTAEMQLHYKSLCQFAVLCYRKCGDRAMSAYLLRNSYNRAELITNMIAEIQYVFPELKSYSYNDLKQRIRSRLREFTDRASIISSCDYKSKKPKQDKKIEIRDYVLLLSLNKNYFEQMTWYDLQELISLNNRLPIKNCFFETPILTSVFKQHIDVLKNKEERIIIALRDYFHVKELMQPDPIPVNARLALTPDDEISTDDVTTNVCRIM